MITDRASARDVTADDVLDLVVRHVREESALEYKVSPDADLLKAACAIANFGGGFILIGVAEDENEHTASEVVHLENCQRVVDSVRQRLRDGLTPRPVFEVVSLAVEGKDIVVVRVSPQNLPHMVSSDHRSDFYTRYDGTSVRMRYDEIEQAFRDKHSVRDPGPQTTKITIESTRGRTEVSVGAAAFLTDTVKGFSERDAPSLVLIAASAGIIGALSYEAAQRLLQVPLYFRSGGWLVSHPKIVVNQRRGVWEQPYGDLGLTTLTRSGDVIFWKSVDEVLCWTQDERDFEKAPRIYPNALVEFCLSFAYLVVDVVASTRPTELLVVPMLVGNDSNLRLPLGEGGSIWFNSQVSSAHSLIDKTSVGTTMVEGFGNAPIYARDLAFRLAAQVYSFFGYRENDVAFSQGKEITFESDADNAVMTSVRAYLRTTLNCEVSVPHEDFNRGIFVVALDFVDGRRLFSISEEFLSDFRLPESKLYELLDSWGVAERIRAASPKERLLLATDGVMPLPS